MTSKEQLKKRHLRAVVQLQKVANPKVFKYGLMECGKAVGQKLEVSPQTVINYISGRVKDGYLTEAIAQEFENLTIETN